MQHVSNEYKESMKSTLRERAYIMISFGLINHELQTNATIENGKFSYLSNKTNVFNENHENVIYASLESNFTRVDGTMFFPPKPTSQISKFDSGIISEKMVSDEQFELTINLNVIATDFKGISVEFGENYPVDFDVIGNGGTTIQVRGNDKSNWKTEEVIVNSTSIKFKFYAMKNANTRVRIYSIIFGYGLIYTNDSIMDSTLESYISPIGADVPQIDFSVTLKNYDKYFNVDNPNSAINYLETGQEMNIKYGYQLPNSNTIEWIQGNRLLCSEWESDDTTATIRCEDVFRSMESEYYKGSYNANGRSYYDLAVDVLKDSGITDYVIEPYLKRLYTTNPLPRVQHKEALQIIANACRCVLLQTRLGQVQIKSTFKPFVEVSTNGESPYSNISNVINNSIKKEYATLDTDYTKANGSMYFIPRNANLKLLNVGYVSDVVSNTNNTFSKNPIITLKMETIVRYYGIDLTFGSALPTEFIIRGYKNSELLNTFTVTSNEIDTVCRILRDFDEVNEIQIEFTKTKKPNNRIVVNYISMLESTEFTITRRDMTSYPKAIKQELVKEIIVPCYSYQSKTETESVLSEKVDVISGQVDIFYLDTPSYGFIPKLDDNESLVEIVESGNYYVSVRYKTSGSYQLDVQGYQYKVVEQYITIALNTRGKTIKWDNPLISNTTMANELGEWLADYYRSGIEYEYDTRGNPELDVGDIIYQENDFVDNMKVNVYRTSLQFKQSFSGQITSRRVIND